MSTYQFGDENRPRFLMLRIRLGTDNILVAMYPEFGYHAYEFATGKIFSKDRDAIIIGVADSHSNFSATDLWVLQVEFDQTASQVVFPYLATRLDTTDQLDGRASDILKGTDSVWGLLAFGSLLPSSRYSRITRMPEITDIEGSPLQGLRLTTYDHSEGHFRELENVIYWKDGLWEDEHRSYIGKWEFSGDWTPVSE